MGTRGIMAVHVDGETKAAYNHFDSYPEYLGKNLAEAVMENDSDMLTDLARNLRAIDPTKAPTAEERDALAAFYDPNVGGPADSKDPEVLWYQYLRGTQGDLLAMLRAGRYEDGRTFAFDSLFCEWGYVVNFDDRVLEVYRGFQKDLHTDGRFSDWGDAELYSSSSDTYFPIRLVEAIPFDELPHVEMTSARFDPEYA